MQQLAALDFIEAGALLGVFFILSYLIPKMEVSVLEKKITVILFSILGFSYAGSAVSGFYDSYICHSSRVAFWSLMSLILAVIVFRTVFKLLPSCRKRTGGF